MKNLIQIFLYHLFFFALLGCSQKKDYHNPKEFYSLKDTLRAEILPTPLASYGSLFYTEYGILMCTKAHNGLFQLLDSTNASVITVSGKRGRGPNEFLMAMPMQYDYIKNLFFVSDGYKQELFTYSISPDTISLLKSINLKRDLQRIKYVNDSLISFINFYPDQKLGLMNSNAEVLYEEEYTPLHDDRIKTDQGYHNVHLEISPDRKYTVISNVNLASVSVFLNRPNRLELKWHKMLFEPKYKFNPKTSWFILSDEHYFGFRDLHLSNKYIYLSCDDTQRGDLKLKVPNPKHTYILVMDYEGNIVNKYLLDKFVSVFTISPDGRSLYAIIDNPDLLIAKYTL